MNNPDRQYARNETYRRVTGTDVARQVGLSQSTVSLVFSGRWHGRVSPRTAAAVLKAAQDLGYTPNLTARNLKNGSTGTILMILPVLSNPYLAQVHANIAREAARYSLSVLVYPLDASDEQTALPVSKPVVDGIIGCSVEHSRIKELAHGTPLVMIDSEPIHGVATINADIAGGMTDALTHLANLGHRRIVHLAAARRKWTFQQRANSLDNICRKQNIAIERSVVRLTLKDSYARALQIINDPNRPGAIVCDNDQIALGVFWAARRIAVTIPESLSVVGFDDSDVCQVMDPQLTTVALPMADMVNAAIFTLSKLLNGKEASSLLLPTTLVVRGSTSEARGGL